jgi:small conductance mechanosensitive channel
METQTTDFILASRSAITQLSALAVHYSLSVLGAVLLLLVGWFLTRLVHRWALTGMQQIRGFDITLSHFLANVIRYALMTLVLVMVLGQFGVQTTSIIAALGAAGLAIGLALQGTLQNIAAGIMLLVLRPFRVGEAIETNNVAGTVQEIGLFATELRTSDGLYLLAPNSALWNTPVKNYSRLPTRSQSIKVVLSADADLGKVQERMLEIARADNRVLSSPAPSVSVSEITRDTVTLALNVWFNTADFGAGNNDIARGVKAVSDEVRV